jgi:putative ABC transport system permease protein
MLAFWFRLVSASLWRNRLRTILTVLGIGIGIAAVICTAALGAAGSQQIQQQMNAIGEDFIWIRAGSLNFGGVRTGLGGVHSLTPEDASALTAGVPGITECSPQFQGREQVITAGRNWNTRFQAVWPAFFDIRRRTLSAGALFTNADLTSGARVVVLGQSVADQLFDGEDPVGRTVRINRFPFQIVGVLARRGTARGGVDRDDTILVPLETAHRYLQRQTWVTDIMCSVASPDLTDSAEQQAAALLRVRHEINIEDPDDFQVEKPIEFLEMRAEASSTMGWMLTAIGSVSLLVGGVGIMNIMLVSVTERRNEIGVRLALGARVRDIRSQFLSEAALLGLAGGGLGIALGWVSCRVLSATLHWPTVISPEVTFWATVSAVGSGLVFGYFPAHRASQLDPIDAIRIEE